MNRPSKNTRTLWWLGAGCIAVAGTFFTVFSLSAVIIFVSEIYAIFGEDFTPPPFVPANYAGDGLMTYETVDQLSQQEAIYDPKLRYFGGPLYAFVDGAVHQVDPETGESQFDTVDEWFADAIPYTGADGSIQVGYIVETFDEDEYTSDAIFFGSDWDSRWNFPLNPPAEDYTPYLDAGIAADLDGDGTLECLIRASFYNDQFDYDSPIGALRMVRDIWFASNGGDTEVMDGVAELTAVDSSGNTLWSNDGSIPTELIALNIDGEPGDELLYHDSGELVVLDGKTGEEKERRTGLPEWSYALESTPWAATDPAKPNLLLAGTESGLEFYDPYAGEIVQTITLEDTGEFWFAGAAMTRLRPDRPPFLVVLFYGYDEHYDTVSVVRIFDPEGNLVYHDASRQPFGAVASTPLPDGTDALYFLGYDGALTRARMIVDPN